MLFHKGGPLAGQSRGYAFVTFSTTEGAMKALQKLDGQLVLNRPIAIRLAKNVNHDELDRNKPRIEIPALGAGKREEKITRDEAIKAIEHRLKIMERRQDGGIDVPCNYLGIGPSAGGGPEVPLIQRYNKDRENRVSGGIMSQTKRYKSNSSMTPYQRGRHSKYRKK